MNIESILTLVVLIIVIGISVYKIIRNKRDGKCSCGCESCANKSFCSKYNE